MSQVAVPPLAVPVGGVGHRGLGWWGVVCLVISEGALFGYLLFSYYYYAAQLPASWMPRPLPSFGLAGPNTIILLLSSVAAWRGERAARVGRDRAAIGGFAIAFLLGVVFLVVQGFEWHAKPFSLTSGLYGSLYFTITGFHMAHVLVGVIALAAVMLWSRLGYFDANRHVPVLITTIYWHFVDVVWLCVFTTFYITPYLG